MTNWQSQTDPSTTWTQRSATGFGRTYYFDDPNVYFDDPDVFFDDESFYDPSTDWTNQTDPQTTWTEV